MSDRRNRREVDRLVDVVGDMHTVLDELTRSVLADLVRRAEQAPAPDGYPTSSRGAPGTVGTSDPTGTLVVRRDEATGRRDVVGDTLAEIVANLHEARGLLLAVDRKRKAVVNAGALIKDNPTSVTWACDCCGRAVTGRGNDRLKSGYGPCCYQPWRAWKAAEIAAGREPSHVRFERHHAEQHRPDTGGIGGYEVEDIDDLQSAGVLPTQ